MSLTFAWTMSSAWMLFLDFCFGDGWASELYFRWLCPGIYFWVESRRDFTTQMTKATIAPNRMTGSASIKMGMVPDVSVTRVDESRIRQTPEARKVRPVLSRGFIRAMIQANAHTATPISGYTNSILRGMVPLAWP